MALGANRWNYVALGATRCHWMALGCTGCHVVAVCGARYRYLFKAKKRREMARKICRGSESHLLYVFSLSLDPQEKEKERNERRS